MRTLRTYDRNARTHSASQIAQIVAAIRKFGYTNSLLIDEQNQIIAGYGRHAAATELGMDAVPCIRVVGLSEAEKCALVLADNQIALNAGWDEKLLAEELKALQFAFDAGDLDIDLDSMGFSDSFVKDLMVLPDEPAEIAGRAARLHDRCRSGARAVARTPIRPCSAARTQAE